MPVPAALPAAPAALPGQCEPPLQGRRCFVVAGRETWLLLLQGEAGLRHHWQSLPPAVVGQAIRSRAEQGPQPAGLCPVTRWSQRGGFQPEQPVVTRLLRHAGHYPVTPDQQSPFAHRHRRVGYAGIVLRHCGSHSTQPRGLSPGSAGIVRPAPSMWRGSAPLRRLHLHHLLAAQQVRRDRPVEWDHRRVACLRWQGAYPAQYPAGQPAGLGR